MATCVALALVLGLAGTAAADQIDCVAASISPTPNFLGGSGNFTLASSVTGNTEIDFNLTFTISTQGNTAEYPRPVTFGVINDNPPGNPPAVYFGATGTATSYDNTFTVSSKSATTQVRIIAPVADGDYHVKIGATAGTGGKVGLTSNGIVVHFTVSNLTSDCNPAATTVSLTLDPLCVFYHANSTTFNATLTSSNSPLAGKLIYFTVEGNDVGSASTDANGLATLNYNPSDLPVGNHTVDANFRADGCAYQASGISATLGVKYNFLGFQPPVKIDGAGVGLFSGKVIPVKIKIADAFGNPVPDALAYVFFGLTSLNTQLDMADPLANTNGDSGNLMRYDPATDQYIFNWDISKVPTGSYNIRSYMGEGSCADSHLATVAIQSSGRKR